MATCHSKSSGASVAAVGYLRRSTSKQEKSLDEQRREIERYAGEHGYRVVRWYQDDAISGDATECRVDFQRMHHDACNGRDFDVILCWDQDRFGRFSPHEASYWTFPLAKAGVTLVTVTGGPVDWHDFTNWLTYSVNQHGKHQYLRDLSRNVARGLITNAKRGYSCGQSAPYGYDRMLVDEHGNHKQRVRNGEQVAKPRGWHVTLVPSDDPLKVETARGLFEAYANTDTGLRTMADQLNARGIPGPSGGAWYAASIREILRNDKYVGTFSWAKRREGKYHRVAGDNIRERDHREVTLAPATGKPHAIDNPQEAWIVVDDAHEPLVDRETFQRVQDKLQRRRRNQPSGYAYRTHTRTNADAYLLTGLVYCQHCGCKMHGQTNYRVKNGKRYGEPKYLCSTYNRSGKSNPHGCGCHQMKQSSLVDVLVRKLRDVVLAGSRDRLERIIAAKLAKRSKPDTGRVDALRRRLRDLDQQIDRGAERLLTAPDDLLDVLGPKLSSMKRDRQRVQDELRAAEASAKPVDVQTETRAVVERLWTLADDLDQADPARVREVLRRMVDRVELRFDHVQRGKRLECPFSSGEIHLNPAMFSCVSRGDRI